MRKLVLAAVAALTLASSSALAKPVPEIPLEEGATDGVVYIYRLHINSPFWLPRGVLATLDGKKIANLPYNGCTAFRIPAGRHAVGADWAPSLIFSLDLRLLIDPPGPITPAEGELVAGERRYFRFYIKERPVSYNTTNYTWGLEEVSPDQARKEMAKCFYVKPRLT